MGDLVSKFMEFISSNACTPTSSLSDYNMLKIYGIDEATCGYTLIITDLVGVATADVIYECPCQLN